MKQPNDEDHGHADVTSGLQKNGVMVLLVAESCCVTGHSDVALALTVSAEGWDCFHLMFAVSRVSSLNSFPTITLVPRERGTFAD